MSGEHVVGADAGGGCSDSGQGRAVVVRRRQSVGGLAGATAGRQLVTALQAYRRHALRRQLRRTITHQWRHFSRTLGGGLTFHTQLLLRVLYCNA